MMQKSIHLIHPLVFKLLVFIVLFCSGGVINSQSNDRGYSLLNNRVMDDKLGDLRTSFDDRRYEDA